MAKNRTKLIKEPEAGTMEQYIYKLIAKCDARLNDKDNPVSYETFLYHTGAKNALYMLLTGHNNPLSNSKEKSEGCIT